MLNLLKAFGRSADGATAIEYALIAGLVALAIVGGLTALGPALSAKYEAVSEGFE